MPKRTGTAFRWSKKEQERRSGAFRLETNPDSWIQTEVEHQINFNNQQRQSSWGLGACKALMAEPGGHRGGWGSWGGGPGELTIYRWCTVLSPTSKYDEPEVENVARGRSPSATLFDFRMTNYKLLRWLVEMPSRDVVHYRMINASRSTVTRSRDVH